MFNYVYILLINIFLQEEIIEKEVFKVGDWLSSFFGLFD